MSDIVEEEVLSDEMEVVDEDQVVVHAPVRRPPRLDTVARPVFGSGPGGGLEEDKDGRPGQEARRASSGRVRGGLLCPA